MKAVLLLTFILLSSGVSAECVTNARGRTVCGNGEKAVAVNPHTGTAATAQKNQNGVTTTQTSKGGKAKTKNGKGVYKSPSGTKCVKTANNAGCN
ncbi:MAG: hypothetical protein ACXWNV_12650 [Vulcanimicrobiaceae bacterium]